MEGEWKNNKSNQGLKFVSGFLSFLICSCSPSHKPKILSSLQVFLFRKYFRQMIISFLAQKKAYCKHRSRLEYYRLQDEGYAGLRGKAVMPGPPRGSDASSLTQQDDLATEAPTQKKGKESTKQKRRKPAKGAEWQPSMAPRIGQQGHCYTVSMSTVRIFKDSEDKRSDARNQGHCRKVQMASHAGKGL